MLDSLSLDQTDMNLENRRRNDKNKPCPLFGRFQISNVLTGNIGSRVVLRTTEVLEELCVGCRQKPYGFRGVYESITLRPTVS
jgi:hypothetical protein